MRIEVAAQTLSELKTELQNKVDADAEKVRLQYITAGSGQALVYELKEREAKALKAGGEIGPHLAAESRLRGLTVDQIADLILATAAGWRMISAEIDALRLATKDAIAIAPDHLSARAAATIDWRPLLPTY